MINDPISILIVEDEVIIAMEIDSRLQNRGYNVIATVASSENAIKIAIASKPHVIIMDIHIQGSKDGIDAAREIFETYRPVVIFISAYTDDETKTKVAEVQPSYFLAKPISYEELARIIHESAIENGQDYRFL
jgi:DNA-binding NarL/FixJ family response regulator